MPSARSVGADIACLLTTYARPVPAATEDPDETNDSPFRQLQLMVHYTQSDTYRIDRGPKPVPSEILCYSMAVSFHDDRASGGQVDVDMWEASVRPGGPGRVLALSPDAFAASVACAERELGPDNIRSEMVGGHRLMRVADKSPVDWLAAHYGRVG